MRRRSSNIYRQPPQPHPSSSSSDGITFTPRVIARLRKSQNWNLISNRVGQPEQNREETEKANIPFLRCCIPSSLSRRIIRSTYLSGETRERDSRCSHRSRIQWHCRYYEPDTCKQARRDRIEEDREREEKRRTEKEFWIKMGEKRKKREKKKREEISQARSIK